jgi:hypothetical protein
MVGNADLAKQQAQGALALSNGRDVERNSAVALALAGDSVQATRLAEDLAKRFPEDTLVQSEYVPMVMGPSLSEVAGPPRQSRPSQPLSLTSWPISLACLYPRGSSSEIEPRALGSC